MNVVGHIIRKDIRRLRWILLLWVVVLITAGVMAHLQAQLDAETYHPFNVTALIFEAGLGPLIAFGLVMGLVDDDPVADGDAFWITRPISSGQLLAAKSLGMALFWLLPLAAAFPWWLGYSFGGGEVAGAVVYTLQRQALVTLLAVPIAVISANGSRFVLNVIIAAAIVAVLAIAYTAAEPAGAPTSGVGQLRMAGIVWLVVSLAIAANQFYSRNTRFSATALLVSLIACFVVARWGPVQPGPDASPDAGDRIELAVQARKGASASSRGHTIKIQDSLLDFTGKFEVAVSETAPLPRQDTGRESYALVHPRDGTSLIAEVARWGGGLDVAAVRHTHALLTFKAQQVSATWLEEANLVKETDFEPSRP